MHVARSQPATDPRWVLRSGRPQPPAAASRRAAADAAVLPSRYRIEQRGRACILRCSEAPTLAVHLERGLSFTASEALQHAPGAIFLDGAAQGPPLLCPERALYNLDHHDGCVRAFTLATCEQAMVLIRKHVDLRRREWKIYANDADLDTLLALWVLLNHLRLVHLSPETRARILPLLRLEGCIDAQGLELQDLCALPPDALEQARRQMAALRRPELELQQAGRWDTAHLGAYVSERLREIDRMVYDPGDFEGLPEVEELARAEVGPGSVAVVCRAKTGVYEVERELRRIHGDRLALFALQKDDATYTLRRVDPSLPVRLDSVYAYLNLVDPGSDGAVSSNRWGGSDEIGGSPRQRGSRMSPRQLAEACQRALVGARRHHKLLAAVAAAGASLALVALGHAPAGAAQRLAQWLPASLPPELTGALVGAPMMALLACVLLLCAGRRRPGLYGLRPPALRDSWRALPLALLGAAAGGVWLPRETALAADAPSAAAALLALLPALLLVAPVEIIFRGLAHGLLGAHHRMQQPGGGWFVSLPVAASALLYTGAAAVCGGAPVVLTGWLPASWPAALLPLAGALLFGVAAGLVRERSESVVTPILLHALCAALVLAAAS
jgi:hypothetical protein